MEDSNVLDSFFKTQQPKNPFTTPDEIIVIVDRSGSMSSIRSDAEGGLNSFVKEQQKVGEANLTLVEFDSEIVTVHDRINIKEAKEYKLVPRGNTALLDAVGVTLNKHLHAENNSNGKKIVVIITDGAENSSREYTRDKIFNLITELKTKEWEFLFLAANQDAIQAGGSIGIDAKSTVRYAASGHGVQDAYMSASVYTSSLRTKTKAEAIDDLNLVKASSDNLS